MSNAFNLLTGTNAIEYMQGNPLANLMLSVKYFFSSDYNGYFEVPSYYKLIDQQGSIKLYENEEFLDPGILLPNDSRENRKDFKNALEYQNKFANNIGSKDIYKIYSPEIISKSEYEKLSVSSTDNTSNASEDQIYIVYDELNDRESYDTEIYVPSSIKGYIYLSYLNTLYYLGDNSDGQYEFAMSFDENFLTEDYIKTVKIGVPDLDNLAEIHDILAENTMTDLSYGYNTIDGKIDASYDGTIFLTIPAYDAWDVYVDGSKVQHEQFMGAMGIPVTTGKHDIHLIYHTAGLKEGAIISLISLIIFIIYLILRKIIRTKKSDSEDNQSDIVDEAIQDTVNSIS
jgi:Predicted membrane protein